jgi:hypothetical protein
MIRLMLPLLFTCTSATISVSWKDCGSATNHIKITDVSWSPTTINPGDNVTITASGILDEDIVAPYEQTITFASIFKHTFDVSF